VGLIVVLALGAAVFWRMHDAALARQLLATPARTVAAHADLVRFATAEARPLFARNCAGCHGADMKGNKAIGAPDLTDRVWVYGNGSVFDIERTILYGIRSGQKQGHDVTEMPAFGQRGMLTAAQIDDVVQYLLALSRRPHDPEAAERGHTVFTGPASCNDCHAFDARGDAYYGAPDLTANTWMYGGDVQSLKNSVYFGRHGVMPGWRGKLSLQQIRALAVSIYARSHPKAH
jgi:cytochrome c oxidase cbb3-type subunit 3